MAFSSILIDRVFVLLLVTCFLTEAENASHGLEFESSHGLQTAAAFTVVSGISAPEEFCLSVEGGGIGIDGAALILERCSEAVALGDGRDLFSLQAGGQLLNVAGGKCVGLRSGDLVDGGELMFGDCDTASRWEVQGNGQLKLNSAGDFCLSQKGLVPGKTNVAAKAAVMASSTANVLSHGAAMAVDGNAGTFWASKFDDTNEPVEFVLDLGEAHKLHSIDLSWEFPARAFSVSLSADGQHFQEAFATDANVVTSSQVPLGNVDARILRIVMHEPHPTHARFQGHLLYGIRSVAVYAHRLRAVISECAKAAKSSDARDKYFLSYVSESDPFPAKALRSELPSLEAAKASLAGTISELADVLPQLSYCGAQALSSVTMPKRALPTRLMSTTHTGTALVKNGLDSDYLDLLLTEARMSVIGIRRVLA